MLNINFCFSSFLSSFLSGSAALGSSFFSSVDETGEGWCERRTHSTVKPIFHCDAKYLTSGVGVGQCPRRQKFALEIPTCWYILALPNAKICVILDAKPKICVTPDANPRRQSVEYRWRWGCTFHIFCGDFICVWWSTQTQYPVEYGLKVNK